VTAVGPPKTASMAELKEAASVGGLFHIRPIRDIADGTFQKWRDVRLRSAKRVKADVPKAR
jgi:hypothetical protein